MPGTMPMKVIKVGTGSQCRVAQACDRCRSKKIRCDGVRPCCSQCAGVGFVCRTTDKLSRRAFPRGYTESLEERVRSLEAEVRQLKELLDGPDCKVERRSSMHSHANYRSPVHSSPGSVMTTGTVDGELVSPLSWVGGDGVNGGADGGGDGGSNDHDGGDDGVGGDGIRDSYLMGPSSGRSFIETFNRKMQERGSHVTAFNPQVLLQARDRAPRVAPAQPRSAGWVPTRLFTDRYVKVYFQEWASLFPVLDQPVFLRLYGELGASPQRLLRHDRVGQLYLVLCIAALSSGSSDLAQLEACERQWRRALDLLLATQKASEDDNLATLQCLVLALMYCAVRGDHGRLRRYKTLAVDLSNRLGLHLGQDCSSLRRAAVEMRRRLFWTLYTLDCFSAALLGLPKLLIEDEIEADYPSEREDDEYMTDKTLGLTGGHTQISSALALFRLARVLAKVVERNDPACTWTEPSMRQLTVLHDHLTDWYNDNSGHLTLDLAQDRSSSDVNGSRSAIIAIAFHYTRILIHRPAVSFCIGPEAAPSLIAMGDSSKRLIQILDGLKDRGMSLAFCLNRTDLLVMCGLTLLYQALNLKPESLLMREAERLVNVVLRNLDKDREAPVARELRKVSSMLVSVVEEEPSGAAETSSTTTTTTMMMMAAPPVRSASMVPITMENESVAARRHPLGAEDTPQLRRKTMSDTQGDETNMAANPGFPHLAHILARGQEEEHDEEHDREQEQRQQQQEEEQQQKQRLARRPSQPPNGPTPSYIPFHNPFSTTRQQHQGRLPATSIQASQLLLPQTPYPTDYVSPGKGSGSGDAISLSPWEQALLGCGERNQAIIDATNNSHHALYVHPPPLYVGRRPTPPPYQHSRPVSEQQRRPEAWIDFTDTLTAAAATQNHGSMSMDSRRGHDTLFLSLGIGTGGGAGSHDYGDLHHRLSQPPLLPILHDGQQPGFSPRHGAVKMEGMDMQMDLR